MTSEKISSYEQKKINYAAMEESISTLTAEKEKLLKDYEKLSNEFSNSKLSGAIADALSSAGAKNLKAAEALIDKFANADKRRWLYAFCESRCEITIIKRKR